MTGALYLTGNDGTLMSGKQAQRLPLHTFQSGPVNSLRGAAKLSGLSGVHSSMSAGLGGRVGGGGREWGRLGWWLTLYSVAPSTPSETLPSSQAFQVFVCTLALGQGASGDNVGGGMRH